MDDGRFDAIAKSLCTATSRRTFGALVGGALGLAGQAAPDAAAGSDDGRCRPRCGRCERCRKGRCRRTPRGRRCAEGQCQPKPNGRSCGRCKECRGGDCVAVENGTECGSDNLRRCIDGRCDCVPGTVECRNGTCLACGGPQRTNPARCACCAATGEPCIVGVPSTCCSNNCVVLNPNNFPNGTCLPLSPGAECEFDAQCASNDCRNGTCASKLGCTAGQDFCRNGEADRCPGNPDCNCVTSASGTRHCSDFSVGRCSDCASDDDCPDGQICINGSGAICDCPDGKGCIIATCDGISGS